MPLYNPAASGGASIIGSQRLVKSIDFSTLPVGRSRLVTAVGGASRIESIAARVTTTFTSGGAPTLSLGTYNLAGVNNLLPVTGLATLMINRVLRSEQGATHTTNITAAGAWFDPARGGNTVQVTPEGPFIFDSRIALMDAIWADILVAVYTAGVIEFTIIYSPLTAGATLS